MSDHNYEGALYERAGAAVVRANKLAEKTKLAKKGEVKVAGASVKSTAKSTAPVAAKVEA